MKKMTPFYLSKKNISGNMFRSIAMIVSVAVIAGCLFSITLIFQSVNGSLNRGSGRLGADIVVVPFEMAEEADNLLQDGPDAVFYLNKNIQQKLNESSNINQMVSQLFGRTGRQNSFLANILLVGVDFKNDLTLKSWLPENFNGTPALDEIVLGNDLQSYASQPEIRLKNRGFKPVAILEKSGLKFFDNSIFMHHSALSGMLHGRGRDEFVSSSGDVIEAASIILVQTRPGEDVAKIASILEYEVDGIKCLTTEQIITSIRGQLLTLLKGMIATGVVIWGMAMMLIGVVFSTIVNERTAEIGLLRAMGAKKKTVFSLIINEAVILSTIGGICGLITSALLIFTLNNQIKTILNISTLINSFAEIIALVVICLVMSVLTGTAASFYPALRSMQVAPYSVIREG